MMFITDFVELYNLCLKKKLNVEGIYGGVKKTNLRLQYDICSVINFATVHLYLQSWICIYNEKNKWKQEMYKRLWRTQVFIPSIPFYLCLFNCTFH
jgi:hypothetical protein